MSDQSGGGQEKSHDATPQKLERARRQGDLVRSQDAQTFAAYLGLAIVVLVAGHWSTVALGETLQVYLSRPFEMAVLHTEAGGDTFAMVSLRIAGAVAPVVLAPAVLIVILLIAQRGIVLAPAKLLPKISRISPVANAKQKYGPHGLMEFVKSAAKLVAIGGVLAVAVIGELDELPGYVRIEPRHLGLLLERQFWSIATGVMIVAFALAVLDLIWQRHRHLKTMRMTHQELRDESKNTEGDPHIRASRRERGRQIASNRMLHEVPGASVVITNPEHYAVALKWEREKQAVPVCVAKGVDELARTIRLRAVQAGVPLREDPPTARSLHAMVEVGQPIQPEHYKAVAAAIVFAEKLRARDRERNGS